MAGNNTTGYFLDALNSTNISINTTQITQRATETMSDWSTFLPLVLVRVWDILLAPFRYQDMLWIIFHLLVTLFVVEFYFMRHTDEELGWAAAVANSLVLFIIAIDLIRHTFHDTPFGVLKTISWWLFAGGSLPISGQMLLLILILLAFAIGLTLVNFYHLLPKKMAFEISGHPPINFLAFFAIVIVYTEGTPHEVPLDIPAIVAGIIVYVMLLGVVFFTKRSFGPNARQD
jgi:hypothetical protein